MERRTRGRPKRSEESTVAASDTNNSIKKSSSSTTRSSPSRRKSPGRPPRRSSRSRSTILGVSASEAGFKQSASVTPRTPIKEVKESPQPESAVKSKFKDIGLSSVSPPIKSMTTSSVHSSYSTSTHRTVELRSTASHLNTEIGKLSEFIRKRSVSQPFSGGDKKNGNREVSHTPTTNNTEAESRYSRSVSRSVTDDDNYLAAEFSDSETNGRDVVNGDDQEEEENEHYKSLNVTHHQSFSTSALGPACRQLDVPREFGGWIGATILMLSTPCVVYYLQWCCSKAGCALKEPHLSGIFESGYILKNVFRGEAVAAYFLFNMAMFMLSGVLFGRRIKLNMERNSEDYKFNALSMGVLITIALGVAEYLKLKVVDFILQNYLRFCLYSFVNAFVVALWCYLRADMLKGKVATQMNIYGRSGNLIIDYALGRQINPKWLGLVEFKQVFYRTSLITTLLFAECFIYKSIQLPSSKIVANADGILNVAQLYLANTKYDSAALLGSLMLLLYITDAILFEHHLASSFELQGEGFGCLLLIRYAATPFLLSSVAKYFYANRTPITCKYAIYVAVLFLLAGLVLKRFSSALKYKFRIAPMNPIFNGMESIRTYQGKRLLLGSIWGWVRQPNYTGDLLALIGLVVPLFLRFAWTPLLSVLIICGLLLHRTQRVNARNTSRYHSSWARYRKEVRYYILPKVY